MIRPSNYDLTEVERRHIGHIWHLMAVEQAVVDRQPAPGQNPTPEANALFQTWRDLAEKMFRESPDRAIESATSLASRMHSGTVFHTNAEAVQRRLDGWKTDALLTSTL